MTPLAVSGGDTGLPPFSPAAIFTQINPFSLIALGLVVSAALYLYGVWRLRQRGDAWPAGRTASSPAH